MMSVGSRCNMEGWRAIVKGSRTTRNSKLPRLAFCSLECSVARDGEDGGGEVGDGAEGYGEKEGAEQEDDRRAEAGEQRFSCSSAFSTPSCACPMCLLSSSRASSSRPNMTGVEVRQKHAHPPVDVHVTGVCEEGQGATGNEN